MPACWNEGVVDLGGAPNSHPLGVRAGSWVLFVARLFGIQVALLGVARNSDMPTTRRTVNYSRKSGSPQ